jgi:hypothetical protein
MIFRPHPVALLLALLPSLVLWIGAFLLVRSVLGAG